MRTSEAGRKLITQFEGEILQVYLDPVRLPTVGVGHLVKESERQLYPLGKKITRQESQDLLTKDLAEHEEAVNEAVTVPIEQHQFDMLVSLSFNIGVKRFKSSVVVARLNRKNYEAAANAFLNWRWAGGKPMLLKRRTREKNIFLNGYPTNRPIQLAGGGLVIASAGIGALANLPASDLPYVSYLPYLLVVLGILAVGAIAYYFLRK
jgi:lysozyme